MTAIMQDAPSVIPPFGSPLPRGGAGSAQAGIQKRERFFATLHNTSWTRDYRAFLIRSRRLAAPAPAPDNQFTDLPAGGGTRRASVRNV